MKRKNRQYVIRFALVMVGICGLSTPWFGAAPEQELKTLQFVKTYQSDEELRVAYPELFPKTNHIRVDGNDIQFIDSETGKILKHIQTQHVGYEFKQPMTEAEFRQLPDPKIRELVDRHFSDDKTFLLVMEGTIKMQSLDNFEEGTFKVTKNTLYDANGEIVTELPLEAGMVVVSLHTRDFVAYNWAEFGGPPSIYFYSSDGTLLQRQEIFEKARVRFSQNGKFITMVGDTREFAIFTNTGKRVYQGNSKEFTPDIKLLRRVCVSENAEQMLLATDLLIYLYTVQGNLLWTNPTPGSDLSDCQFFSTQQKIAFKMATSRSGDDWYNIQIHSLTTGEKLDEIIGVADIASTNDRLIVKRGGQYYEYQIR